MCRPYSTKRWRPIPAEFEAFFIANGWTRCNIAFGKRETLRYVTALGRSRLSKARLDVRLGRNQVVASLQPSAVNPLAVAA